MAGFSLPAGWPALLLHLPEYGEAIFLPNDVRNNPPVTYNFHALWSVHGVWGFIQMKSAQKDTFLLRHVLLPTCPANTPATGSIGRIIHG